MSVIVNICGMLIATSNFPDTTLQQFYQQYYHCNIERSYDEMSTQIQSAQAVAQLFPQPPTWWPVFTVDQLNSESFKLLTDHGIKPGVILPMNISVYWTISGLKKQSMRVLFQLRFIR